MLNGLIKFQDGTKFYYQNNELHRKNGPAVEYASGAKYWFYQGQLVSCLSQEEFEKLIKLKAFW